jgi:SAM-dependent methyltransferase
VRILIVLASCWMLMSAQIPADVEKRIAGLPEQQRAYERFRYWVTTQSGPSADPMPRYREFLRSAGFKDDDIEQQIRTIQQQGSKLEVERWNRILTAETPTFNTSPNAFLVEVVKGRKPGTALDVGMGQGRNAIWLAQQGWSVTGFDPADKAVALAQASAAKLGVKLTTEVKRFEDFDFGSGKWDLIVLSYVGAREVADKIQRGLRSGGIVVVEAFHRDATKGRSIGRGVVFDTGELQKLFPGLKVLRDEAPVTKADFGQEEVRVVRFSAEKP